MLSILFGGFSAFGKAYKIYYLSKAYTKLAACFHEKSKKRASVHHVTETGLRFGQG